MKELTKEQELLLLRIEKARVILAGDLERGYITTRDIIRCISKDDNYRLSNNHDHRDNIIKNIINSPFILCDQDNLDIEIKKLLPNILKVRYDSEIEELYALYDNGDISDDELINGKEMLKFCYYESSTDGKQIFKNGKVKSVVNNRIRCR